MDNPIARRNQVTITYASPAVFRFAASLPSYHKFLDQGGLIFEATRHSIEMYNKAFPDLPIIDADGTVARLEATVTPVTKHKRLVQYRHVKPFNHQEEAIDIALSRPYYAFFDDMGTAKSSTILYIAAELFARDTIDRALIITTKRGRPQFMNEQLPHWIPGVRYISGELPATAKKREMKYRGDALMLGFATPGAFQSKRQAKEISDFVSGSKEYPGRCALFVDESQNFKGWDTERTNNLIKMVEKVSPNITNKYLFSGEPQPNGLEDLLAQFYILDPNIIGHSTKQSFENQYCVKGGHQGREIVDYKNVTELTSRIAEHCRYIKITDIMDMPEQISEKQIFEVPQNAKDAYAEIKQLLMVEIETALASGDIQLVRKTCANAASKFTALAQISNGFIYTDLLPGHEEGDPRNVHRFSTDRAEFVLEELVPRDQKTIIFCRFHEDLQMLAEVMEKMELIGYELSGRIPDKLAELNKLAFQRAESGIFFATTASGGESLNLQTANRTIYYSNSYNYGHRVQSERRTWRTGQTKTCHYIDIIGMPIDRLILRNLDEKKDLSDQLRLATSMAKLVEEL
jgi:hypothetical protein